MEGNNLNRKGGEVEVGGGDLQEGEVEDMLEGEDVVEVGQAGLEETEVEELPQTFSH